MARSRSGVTIVPSMNGRFIRVRPSAWLPASRVVSTTVADEPPERDAAPFIDILPPPARTRRSAPRSHRALGEGQRRVDQPDVRERLREIPERRPGLRVDLLRIEPNVVRVAEQSFEGRGRAGQIPAASAALDRPEAADAEGALPGRQPVAGLSV